MIEIQHLKKQYEASTPLEDVSVTIHKGDVIAVIGPSGTGKSTLLRCINLLETPTSGRILVDGEDITDPKCDLNRVRRKLGMVFQSFNLYEHLTVVENCALAQTTLLKRSRREAYDKAMELLRSVGMEKQALQYPSQLSGGQKQRVAIARTLATDPEIILFDEPTSALDPLTVGEVESVIARLSGEGRTMMIVTHSMEFARRISNRVFYMDAGGIYEDGTPEQIFEHPQKELTRRFIYQVTNVDMLITDENHDLHREIGKIYSFCRAKKLDEKRTVYACGAYEEYLNILYNYYFADDKTLHFTCTYDAETDCVKCTAVPYSAVPWSDVESKVLNSSEYKLFAHYIKSFFEEKTGEGIGTRAVYTL